VKYQSLTGN